MRPTGSRVPGDDVILTLKHKTNFFFFGPVGLSGVRPAPRRGRPQAQPDWDDDFDEAATTISIPLWIWLSG